MFGLPLGWLAGRMDGWALMVVVVMVTLLHFRHHPSSSSSQGSTHNQNSLYGTMKFKLPIPAVPALLFVCQFSIVFSPFVVCLCHQLGLMVFGGEPPPTALDDNSNINQITHITTTVATPPSFCGGPNRGLTDCQRRYNWLMPSILNAGDDAPLRFPCPRFYCWTILFTISRTSRLTAINTDDQMGVRVWFATPSSPPVSGTPSWAWHNHSGDGGGGCWCPWFSQDTLCKSLYHIYTLEYSSQS